MSKQIFRFSNHSKVGLARLSFVALATFGSLVCTSSLATPYIPPRPDQLVRSPEGCANAISTWPILSINRELLKLLGKLSSQLTTRWNFNIQTQWSLYLVPGKPG